MCADRVCAPRHSYVVRLQVSVATLPEPTQSPLADEHHAEIAVANTRAKTIRKAAGVAGFNGWVTAVFAVCSAPFAPFSIAGFLVTVGLAVVAYNEFQGRTRLHNFDREAAKFLGWNQVGFLSLIVAYCGWMLFVGLTGEGPFAAEVAEHPELAEALGSLDGLDALYRLIIVAVYASVIVLTVVFQGLNAYYYFTRRKHIDAYVRETPQWVLDVQRSAAAG